MSASSACGACGVCLIPLLCFGKGSEQSSTTLVCITSFDNMPACACLCLSVSSVCAVLSRRILLAWHLEPVVMEMISVQVEYGKLVDLLFSSHSSTTSNRAVNEIYTPHSFGDIPCGRGIHRGAEAGRTLCCRSSSCLQALDVINRAENMISHCQPVVESH